MLSTVWETWVFLKVNSFLLDIHNRNSLNAEVWEVAGSVEGRARHLHSACLCSLPNAFYAPFGYTGLDGRVSKSGS